MNHRKEPSHSEVKLKNQESRQEGDHELEWPENQVSASDALYLNSGIVNCNTMY